VDYRSSVDLRVRALAKAKDADDAAYEAALEEGRSPAEALAAGKAAGAATLEAETLKQIAHLESLSSPSEGGGEGGQNTNKNGGGAGRSKSRSSSRGGTRRGGKHPSLASPSTLTSPSSTTVAMAVNFNAYNSNQSALPTMQYLNTTTSISNRSSTSRGGNALHANSHTATSLGKNTAPLSSEGGTGDHSETRPGTTAVEIGNGRAIVPPPSFPPRYALSPEV